MPSRKPAIAALLVQLERESHAAHRDIEDTLSVIEPHGESVTVTWLNACRALFDFDREAGRTFIRGSVQAEEVSETVVPWTEEARGFMGWRGWWRGRGGCVVGVRRGVGWLGHAGTE